jgi:hypothetical protein
VRAGEEGGRGKGKEEARGMMEERRGEERSDERREMK